VVGAAGVSVVTLVGAAVADGVEVRSTTLPGLLLALAVGTAACAALGTGVLRLVTKAESATAVTAGLVLPLTFISGVWGDFGELPGWLDTVAKLFPIQHLAHALQVSFDPRTTGSGISGTDLLVLAMWLVAGTLLGVRALRAELRRD
jgi:ABC-type multidrug transport system permease subunit